MSTLEGGSLCSCAWYRVTAKRQARNTGLGVTGSNSERCVASAARTLSGQPRPCGMHTSDSPPYSCTVGKCLCGCLRGCHSCLHAGALCIPSTNSGAQTAASWALHVHCPRPNTGPAWVVQCEELVGTCWLGVAGGGRFGVHRVACARKHSSVPQLWPPASTATRGVARAQLRGPYVRPGEGPPWRQRAWPVESSRSDP